VIPEINEFAKALLAEYGASDTAMLNVIFGRANPERNLPFELPSSMKVVRDQKADVPYDSETHSIHLALVCRIDSAHAGRNLATGIHIFESRMWFV
jgi:hypothetical protein